ncbi:F0F1 ATP synthase assembly protein I [Sphingomonas oleivorans]|uniref:ATP synthase protein I n=1 Tax=Sphingomonas oleivorans TaxID=1735121 RepID=A0A2T5FUW5_9SPHN|nr:AtpZ/AtpI family protein [Sphingomonas oleivorans]PTQ08520.1 F0F1 ATP synthase assembly protein I [Sphingomonas oleivorans]
MSADGTGQDPIGEEDARITSLERRLKAAHHAEAVRTGKVKAASSKGYAQGNRVLAEMIAGPAGGALFGWLLDRWLGTSPWLLLVMIALGIGVAIRNIYRISRERPE